MTTNTEPNSTNTAPIDPPTLIDQVVEFYTRYLSASPEQLDLLALWTLHTYCIHDGSYSPALNITSRHKQSGKSLCLQLLSDLCYDPWFHTSPSPALVLRQTQNRNLGRTFTSTLLLDDCHINTRLRGLLTASFRWEGIQVVPCKDHRGNPDFDRCPAFFPKAFSSSGPLPDSVKDVSITIALEPKKPGSPCRRGAYEVEACDLCLQLQQDLSQWAEEHSQRVTARVPYEPSQFPTEFSYRQQDCAEPLLQLADRIGGDWPQRARNALINIFALSAFEDFVSSRQILSDLRDAFAAKSNPGWISTADLLEDLHTMDNRAWDDWSKGKPLNPKDLAALLKPFGLSPANHRTESGKVIKGYKQEPLDPVWNRYLPDPQIPVEPTQSAARQAAKPELGEHLLTAELKAVRKATTKDTIDTEQNQSRSDGEEVDRHVSAGCGSYENGVPEGRQKSSGREKDFVDSSTAAPGCTEEIQGGENSVAADSQNPSAAISSQEPDPVLRCQPKEALVASNRLGYIWGEELAARKR